jgi:replicative DNA helicase
MPSTPPPTNTQVLAPFSQEAEEAVIGSVMISPPVFDILSGFLRAEDFYLTRHRHMWLAFARLASRREIMDLTTISEELRQVGVLEEIGGYAYLIHLINNTPNSMHAEAYGRLVERTATRRKLLIAADKIREAAMNETLNIEQVVAQSEGAVAAVADSGLTLPTLKSTSDRNKVFTSLLGESVRAYQKNPRYITGIRTGFSDLDIMLDGLPAGISTVAGATGIGKTAWVGTVALNASRSGILRDQVSRPAKTLFFSGEMTEHQLMIRLISNKTGIPARNIQRGNLISDELVKIRAALDDMEKNHTLTIEEGNRLTTAQIRQRVRSLVAYGEIDFLILDGLLQIEDLQLDTSTQRRRQYSDAKRRDAIDNIMMDLEAISLDYKLPILLSHQISRAPAARQNKRPQVSDLAEASFVEQKSSVILFLYRESYYDTTTINPNGAEVIIPKNRHGGSGTIQLFYNSQFTRFEDADVEHISLTHDD